METIRYGRGTKQKIIFFKRQLARASWAFYWAFSNFQVIQIWASQYNVQVTNTQQDPRGPFCKLVLSFLQCVKKLLDSFWYMVLLLSLVFYHYLKKVLRESHLCSLSLWLLPLPQSQRQIVRCIYTVLQSVVAAILLVGLGKKPWRKLPFKQGDKNIVPIKSYPPVIMMCGKSIFQVFSCNSIGLILCLYVGQTTVP